MVSDAKLRDAKRTENLNKKLSDENKPEIPNPYNAEPLPRAGGLRQSDEADGAGTSLI